VGVRGKGLATQAGNTTSCDFPGTTTRIENCRSQEPRSMLHRNHSRCDITRIPYRELASHFDSLPASLPVFEDSGPPHTALTIPRRRPPLLTIAANRTIDREVYNQKVCIQLRRDLGVPIIRVWHSRLVRRATFIDRNHVGLVERQVNHLCHWGLAVIEASDNGTYTLLMQATCTKSVCFC